MEESYTPDGCPSRQSQISLEDSTENVSHDTMPHEAQTQHTSTSEENTSHTPPGSPLTATQASFRRSQSPPETHFSATLPSPPPKSLFGVFGDSKYSHSHNISSLKQSLFDLPGRGVAQQSHLTDDKFHSLPAIELRRQHKRNKTTVSEVANMMMPMKAGGQSPVGPSREAFENDSAEEVPLYRFTSAYDEKLAPPKTYSAFAQQFAISRKPLFPESISGYVQNTYFGPDHHTNESKSLSWQLPEARPKAGHQRARSEDSNDSSSTVASDSWNPVEEFVALSSDDTRGVTDAMSLFNFGASFRSPEESDSTTDMAQIPWVGMRGSYSLDRIEMAGHDHGVAVHDFAYVGGKTPETEQEWTNVQLSHGHRPPRSQNSYIADSSSIFDLGGNREEAGDAMTTEKEEIQQDRSMPVDVAYQLQPTVYEPPHGRKPRIIAEDAGSIFNYANESDGGDESTSRAKLTPPQSKSPTTPKEEANKDDTDEVDDIIRDDLYFPTYMPSPKSSKKASDTTGHKRKTSTTLLQHISAHIPKLTFAKDERGRLNRDFQFPPPEGSLQRVESVPLMGDGYEDEDGQWNNHKRHVSLGRVLKVFMGKGDGERREEYVIEGSVPRKSFLRRQVGRLDRFLERRNW